MSGVITSRTRLLYSRPPSGPFVLNRAAESARGLVVFLPLNEAGRTVKYDLVRNLALTNSGTPTWSLDPAVSNCVNFNGTNQYLSASTAPASAVPVSLACWFNPTSATATTPLVALTNDPSNPVSQFALFASGSVAGDPVQAISVNNSGTNVRASSTVGYVTGVMQHACGVFAATNSRAAYLNGTNKGTNTSSNTASGIDSFLVAAGFNLGEGLGFFSGKIAYVCVWNRVLTDAEVYRLYDPPTRWELCYVLGRKVFGFVGGGGGAFTISCDPGSYSYTGTAATLRYGHKIPIDSGTYSYTGTTTGLHKGYSIVPESGSYTYTGTATTLRWGHAIVPDSGNYLYVGTDTTLRWGHRLITDIGSYSYSGVDVITRWGHKISLDAGSYSYSGQTVDLFVAHKIVTDAGSYSYTGTATTLRHGHVISPDSGSYNYTGVSVGLAWGHKVSPDSGSYSYTGVSVSLFVGLSITLESGSYVYTGQDVTLTVGQQDYELSVDSGSYTYIGQDVTFTITPPLPSPIPIQGTYSTDANIQGAYSSTTDVTGSSVDSTDITGDFSTSIIVSGRNVPNITDITGQYGG